MPNIALQIEYDGSGFHGWQYQPDQRTIQAELQSALETVLRQKVSKLTASGRTDAGVHAQAQTVNFFVKEKPDISRLCHGVSSILKGELSVHTATIVADEFDACRNALKKTYRYIIYNSSVPPVLNKGKVWHVPVPLVDASLRKELSVLCGTHDFSSFRASGCSAKNPVKNIHSIDVTRRGEYVMIDILGSGFLKQMVRNIIGTAVEICKGRLAVDMKEVLAAKDRQQAGITAPAQGLYLRQVFYEKSLFLKDADSSAFLIL